MRDALEKVAPRSTVAAVAGRELSKGINSGDCAVLGTTGPRPIGEIAAAALLARLQDEALRLRHALYALEGGRFRLVQQSTGLAREDLTSLREVIALLAIIRGHSA